MQFFPSPKDTSAPIFPFQKDRSARAVCERPRNAHTFSRFLVNVFAALAITLVCHHDCIAQSFNVQDFRDTVGFTPVNLGTPTQVLSLTRAPSPLPSRGAIWRTSKVPIGGTWSTVIRFSITDTGGAADPSGRGGADGLALVIQDEGPFALGQSGYGIGYHNILGGLAIEVDTWDDSKELSWAGYTEDSADHVAIHSNGRGILSSVPAHSALHTSRRVIDVSDGQVHTLAVRYSPGSLSVYLDDCRVSTLRVPVFLDQWLSDSAWIGITAATQSAWQAHRIHSWCFTTTGIGCGCPYPCDTVYVDRIEYRDTGSVRVDTVERWRYDTLRIAGPRDTVIHYVLRVDSVDRWHYDTTVVTRHDTTTIVRVDSIRVHHYDTTLVYRDTGSIEYVIQVRDTCVGIMPDSGVCGYVQRAYRPQEGVAIRIVPNPARDAAQIEVTAPGAWSVSLHDLRGLAVAFTAGEGSADIALDVGRLASGVYVVRLTCGDVTRDVRLVVRR